MSLQSINLSTSYTLRLMRYRPDFKGQGHNCKVKDQIKVTSGEGIPTPPTNVPTMFQLPTPYGL